MSDTTRMAAIAALLGDPARANILTALMDGRALTAKELAFAAHVSPQTTSGHLARLTDACLLAAEKQGRHRYFRLASPLVGQMLESVMAVAGPEPRLTSWRGGEVTEPGHAFLRDFGAEPTAGRRVFCRPCLDWSERRPHIAGRLGAALACRCFELGWIARQRDTRAVAITPAGHAGFAATFGFELAA